MMRDFPWLAAGPYAHRGLHDTTLPENSLAAFDAAVTAGYGMELDVQISADGQAIVFHDGTLKRLCGRPDRVRDLTAAELGQIKLGDSDERIPTLADTLDLIAGRTALLVEIKKRWRDDDSLDQATANCLTDYAGPAAVQSFEPRVCAWFKQHMPALPRGWISCRYDEDWLGLPALEKYRRSLFIDDFDADPDFFVYNHKDLPFWPVERVREMGKPVLVYTVRSAAAATQAAPYVDNIVFEGFRA
jgi:glycerophosphoryl diester phosphodiesterase